MLITYKKQEKGLEQWYPTFFFFFLVPGTSFIEENSSLDRRGGRRVVSGWFKHIAFSMHFISIIIITLRYIMK